MVKERSGSQFVGLLTRGLDDLFADLLNPEMKFLKNRIYINYLTPIFHYIVNIFAFLIWDREL